MRILVDTCIFLSILYDEPSSEKAIALLKKHETLISVITLAEILASTYKKQEEYAIEAKVLVEKSVGEENVVEVTKETAELAGKLKTRYSSDFSLADAIILATALLTGCDAIATFDPEFKKVREIRIIGT